MGIGPAGPFDAAGRFPGIGTEEHGQPGDGLLIVFPLPAHIAHPGWEVGDGDQFLPEPGEVGNVTQVHDPCRTFIAWISFRSEHGGRFVHSFVLGLLAGVDFLGVINDLPFGWGPVDQHCFSDYILQREQTPLM